MKNLSIYIHIPFCSSKCAYCDFLSAPATDTVQEQYLSMLQLEVEEEVEKLKNEYCIQSVFIGGGTPSIVDANKLMEILKVIRLKMNLSEDVEITIECNPGTLSKDKLQTYYEGGINRLSIGLQSTHNHILSKLGRIHTFETFLEGYKLARKVGFHNINIDLMSALPEQTYSDYRETLETIIKLKPEHISAYSLIIEEGTPFYDMDLNLPTEDTERDMYYLTKELLEKSAYHRYEISNYSKEGYECKHNKVYWERGEYVAFGLGASSFMGEKRYKNQSNIKKYISKDWEKEEVESLDVLEQISEFFFLGLREIQGVNMEVCNALYGEKGLKEYKQIIAKQIQLGLLEKEGEWLKLTEKGIDVSNQVFVEFLL